MTTYPLDHTIEPQDDLFAHVNNSWLRANPVPPTESSWGTFYELRDQSTLAVHDIMNELQDTPDQSLDHDQQLLKKFFKSGLGFNEFSQQHIKTIQSMYTEVDAISTARELAHYLGHMHRQDQNAFWSVYVDHDDKNSQLQVLRIHQSGLSMPNRDYYLDRSAHMKQVRAAHKTFFSDITAHVKVLTPGVWDDIYTLEHALARNSWSNVKLRDIEKNYNRYTLTKLRKEYAFDWDAYFEGLGWQTPSDNIVVSQPSYIHRVLTLLQDTPLEIIKSYLKWRSLLLVVSWIDEASADITFRFYGTSISGVTEMKPVWKRLIQLSDTLVIGEIVGREYAKRHFPESSKQAVLSMVEDVRAAYLQRINALTWMSAETKDIARRKLKVMKVLIGYPSVWKDFSSITFVKNNHVENILTARRFWSDLELAKVGLPPLEEQWEMNAHTVNAYHHPNRLEIVFPAAILQPPFYGPAASYASNLGGIGAVIGHEFTHGFDDQGADFDEHGNTNRWQSPDERKAFDALAQHIVDQANRYETVPGVFLQGKLILGEAIADIGGLELAIEALRMHTSETEFSEHINQLFYTFARCECGHATKERLIELAKIDPHPPSPFRVNAVVGNVATFYETFHVEPNHNLYLEADKRSQIW